MAWRYNLSSPIATVDSYLDASEEKDLGRMVGCWYFADPADRDLFINMTGVLFENVVLIDISNIDKEVTAETENTATVNASYHVTMDFTAESGIPDVDEDITATYDLERHNEDWLIVSLVYISIKHQ